jgi:hypothetical protein
MCVLKYAALHQSALLGANNFKFLGTAAFSRHFPPGAQMQHCYPRTKDGNCTAESCTPAGWVSPANYCREPAPNNGERRTEREVEGRPEKSLI